MKYLLTVKFQPLNEDNTLNTETSEIHCLQSVVDFDPDKGVDYATFDAEFIRAIFPLILSNIDKNLKKS